MKNQTCLGKENKITINMRRMWTGCYECSQLCCPGEGDAEHGGPPLATDYKHLTEGRLLWRESTYKVKSSTSHRTL